MAYNPITEDGDDWLYDSVAYWTEEDREVLAVASAPSRGLWDLPVFEWAWKGDAHQLGA